MIKFHLLAGQISQTTNIATESTYSSHAPFIRNLQTYLMSYSFKEKFKPINPKLKLNHLTYS